MKTRLIFVRHAEAEGNVKREFHGWTDGEITEKGHIQAQKVAERLNDVDIDVIYSSSLKRTMQTAGYISEIKKLPIIRTDKLKEINGGDWEGKRWDELAALWPHEHYSWENKPHIHKMPNGESMSEFKERLISEVENIIGKNKGKNICIVTHGTAIRAMMCTFYDCELDGMQNIKWYDNTSVTIIDNEEGIYKIITEGDVSHLEKSLRTLENQDWWAESIKTYQDNKKTGGIKLSNSSEKLVKWLFETNAVRVCPQDNPFWYTSGTIGPYYINTHFLYGSEEKANALLESIDIEKNNKLTCPLKILEITKSNYKSDLIYNGLIDRMIDYIRSNIDLREVDYISGGERRDWFFSLIISDIFKKPHITIYKDLSTVISLNGIVQEIDNINDKKVLHIADLITEASSYERAWIPAIKRLGGEIKWSVVVVDRKQGGEELLAGEGIKSFSMVNIDKSLFEKVLELELINKEQCEMIKNYLKNPKEAMKDFIERNPQFLKNALKPGGKSLGRAKICLEKNYYDLDLKSFNI